MKERPILFSGPMVRAILAGAKTQTRRIAKARRSCSIFDGSWADEYVLDPGNNEWRMSENIYGVPGDRLWVRETWARDSEDGALFYRADVGTGSEADEWQRNIDDGASGYRWRPSIHMPRWASRITLEITGVRVERLADISDADAVAEGCARADVMTFDGNHELVTPEHRRAYARLWDSINGPGSWDANPWVWVIEFRRVVR